jgi:hypothetical protein
MSDDPFTYGKSRVYIDGKRIDVTNVKVMAEVFATRKDRDAAVQLSKDLDAWNGVAEVDWTGYSRRKPA